MMLKSNRTVYHSIFPPSIRWTGFFFILTNFRAYFAINISTKVWLEPVKVSLRCQLLIAGFQNVIEELHLYLIPLWNYHQFLAARNVQKRRYLVAFSAHCRGLTLRNSLGTFRHKQDSTLVAEQATIFSVHLFLRVNM